jgi:4-amino-4-deoxy-L-arabinose transferase-like glycosyltransferase
MTGTPDSGLKVPTAPLKSLNWRHLSLLAVYCIVIYFIGLGSYGLIDRSDAYYSEGAREMLESGKFLIPKLNYLTFYDKPILMYWFEILSYSILGVNEFAARFSTAFFASFLVFATYLWGTKVSTELTGLRAAFILGTSPMFIALAKQSLVDMTFSAFLVLSLYLIMDKLSGASRWIGAAGYFCLALAVLAKGPLAIVLCGAAVGSYVLATCKNRSGFFEYLRKLDPLVGILILLVVAAPWYVVAAIETNGFWTDIFFIKGNLSRVNGSVGHSHPQLWFYLPVLAYGFFPWILLLPESIYRSISLVRKNWKVKLPAIPERSVQIFLWCWFFGMLAVISVPKAKLQTYILPMLPPLSLLVSVALSECLRQWKETRIIPKYIKFASVIFGICGVLSLVIGCGLTMMFGQPETTAILPAVIGNRILRITSTSEIGMMVSIAVGAIFCGIGLIWQCRRMFQNDLSSVVNMWFASVSCVALVASHAGFWAAYEFSSADLHRSTVMLKPLRDAEVAVFQEFKPSLCFYLQRPVHTFFQPYELLPADSRSKLYIVIKSANLPLLAKRGLSTRTLSQSGDWMVVEKRGVILQKLPTLDEVLTHGNPTLNVEMMTLPLTGGVKP